MNKSILILIVLLAISCGKRDYTCTCTYDSDGSIENISNYNLTQSDAESACNNRDELPDITCVLIED